MNRLNRGAQTNLRHILYDILGSLLAFALCHLICLWSNRYGLSLVNTFLTAVVYTVIFTLCNCALRLYDISIFYYPDRVIRIILAGFVLSSAVVSSLFYFMGRAFANRDFYLLYFSLSLVIHLLSAYLSFVRNRRASHARQTLLIGRREDFARFLDYMRKTNTPVREAGCMLLAGAHGGPDYLGSVEQGDLERVLVQRVIDEVYVLHEPENEDLVTCCVELCLELGVVVRVVLPDQWDGCPRYISSVGTYPVISYHIGTMNIIEQACKRLLDIVGSLVGILLSLPVLLVCAAAIKLDSAGPVLFRQTRVGKNGRRFRILKLRTMTVDAEARKQELVARNEMEGNCIFKIEKDPRITRVGAFLRRTSIDELPQFFNVLAGNMSLVGTRPPTEDEVSQYSRAHWRRLRVKPGITGAWQISGRNAITSFDEIVRLDTEYIENWSLLSDIGILFKTVWVLVQGRGAY